MYIMRLLEPYIQYPTIDKNHPLISMVAEYLPRDKCLDMVFDELVDPSPTSETYMVEM